MEGLVTSQFSAYSDVACIPTGTPLVWANGSEPLTCAGTAQQPAYAYLEDVQVNARCCAPTTGCPMSARSYVLTGATCPNGEFVPAFLGGNNGYQSGWLAYDFIFVAFYMLALRLVAAFALAYISHQRR